MGGYKLIMWRLKKDLKPMIKPVIEAAYPEIEAKLFELLNSERFQNAVYQLGGLAASGAKTGFGLNKGSGKGGLKDILIQMGMPVVQKIFGGIGGGAAPAQATETAQQGLP